MGATMAWAPGRPPGGGTHLSPVRRAGVGQGRLKTIPTAGMRGQQVHIQTCKRTFLETADGSQGRSVGCERGSPVRGQMVSRCPPPGARLRSPGRTRSGRADRQAVNPKGAPRDCVSLPHVQGGTEGGVQLGAYTAPAQGDCTAPGSRGLRSRDQWGPHSGVSISSG